MSFAARWVLSNHMKQGNSPDKSGAVHKNGTALYRHIGLDLWEDIQDFLIRKYNPRNISALPTFIAPIPANTIAATSVNGMVFTKHAHLGRQVLPFATAASKGMQTMNTPILHMAVVAMDSKKKDSITS